MTRYSIDAEVALQLIRTPAGFRPEHRLVAPSLLRSDVLALLYRRVRGGELTEREGLILLDRLAGLRIRLLGDRVSRAQAWRLAAELDWDDPAPAEYLAVALLQSDRFITTDERLIEAAEGRIPVATLEELTS